MAVLGFKRNISKYVCEKIKTKENKITWSNLLLFWSSHLSLHLPKQGHMSMHLSHRKKSFWPLKINLIFLPQMHWLAPFEMETFVLHGLLSLEIENPSALESKKRQKREWSPFPQAVLLIWSPNEQVQNHLEYFLRIEITGHTSDLFNQNF